jgi:phosphatidylethanolamine/phosphatidyl-N-methylethanolamine N-methyltransferase
MLEPLPMARARVVVELGAGTGAMTGALLEELQPHATLFVFETNRRFIDYLKNKFRDPRLVLLNAPAESLGSELRRRGIDRIGAVVSSLGLGFMSGPQRHRLLSELLPFVDEKFVMTQYQYVLGLQFANGRLRRLDLRRLLARYFGSVQLRTVWLNLPPAFVFTCRGVNACVMEQSVK